MWQKRSRNEFCGSTIVHDRDMVICRSGVFAFCQSTYGYIVSPGLLFRTNVLRSPIRPPGELNGHIWAEYGRNFKKIQNFLTKTINLNHEQTRVSSRVSFFGNFHRDEIWLKFQPACHVLKPELFKMTQKYSTVPKQARNRPDRTEIRPCGEKIVTKKS